jgi:PAS domain S-box-containing protein
MTNNAQLDIDRLERSERRYRSLVEAVSVAQAVWVANPNGEYEEDSPSWRDLTGQTYEEFRGLGFLNAIHPDDRERVREAWQSAIEKRSRYDIEYRLRMKNGEYRWVAARGVPVRAEDGSVIEWMGTSTDIHDHRTREGATRFLLKAEELFAQTLDERTIFRNLTQLVVPRLADWCAVDLIDEKGVVDRIAIEHADPSKREMVQEVIRRYPPKLNVSIGLLETVRSGKGELFTDVSDEVLQTLARNDEHRQWLVSLGMESYMIAPLVVRGSVIGAISFGVAGADRKFGRSDLALVEDMAHRVAVSLDNARLYAEAQGANRAKDLFLAMLSHEMKTPLTAILGWARILKMDNPPDEFREAIDAIEQSGLVQQRLIEDLLDVSRVIAGKLHIEPEIIDLREVVRQAVETVQPQAKDKSIAIWTQLPDEQMPVNGDATRLQQVFWNLLTNALKFTPDGGLIEVVAVREEHDCVVSLRDTGRGIKPEVLPYLFDTFHQNTVSDRAEHKGLGLGLAIVRSLTQMHSGSVEAFSEGEGKGSTFMVRLPVQVS